MNIKKNDYEMKAIKEIKKQMDKLPAHERLSYMENNIERLVNKYREELNKEVVGEINKDTSDKSPIPCDCGKNLYYQEEVKKNSL